MKKLIVFIFLLLSIFGYSQEGADIGTPTNSPFQVGGDIQGTIQNSVNEVTGKVTFSVPLGVVASASASYGVNLSYNGQTAFKNGQQTNKYNPTGVVGVGWSLSVPKIIVDNKQTGTRDDDVFYLSDGATNTKLICVNRGATTNGSEWEFQAEKYAPWKIKFFFHNTHDDYWQITKENGLVYTYGNPDVYPGIPSAGNAREYAVRIYNWIGDSKNNGIVGTKHTIAWNLYKIEDQWDNNIWFEYDLVSQNANNTETEASYLKKITSSKGASIQFNYGSKVSDEYYEPNTEAPEPDAYQERYEKKYLQSVSSYNNENQLVSTYNMGYHLEGSVLTGNFLTKKRYLTSVTQTAYDNGVNEVLPPQEFDYHYTGVFKGGIKKIIYPAGGSVTYNYKNKLLFTNGSNLFDVPFIAPSGYVNDNVYVNDNYVLSVYRTENKVSGDKYRYKFFRFWWNGEKWKKEEFTFPHLMEEIGGAANNMKDFYAVIERDFYGFAFDKGATADIYLWHLKKDGRTWDYYTTTNKSIGGDSENIDDFPSFVSGEDFVALGAHHSGNLYTYVWNGSYWNYKQINQGAGEYYMRGTNNFIISINEQGSTDMVTGIHYPEDNYYIHYLDGSRQWNTKSWSAAADPHINDIWITDKKPGYANIYPSNSIAGLVIKNNNELFLRWDTNYNLTHIDDELGAYDDSYYFIPVNNSMFSLADDDFKWLIKTARFNGLSWKIGNLNSGNTHLGIDYTISRNGNGSTYKDVIYQDYSANTDSWTSGNLISVTTNEGNLIHGINKDFIIARNKIFANNLNLSSGGAYSEIGNFWNSYQPYTNLWTHSDGLYHAFSTLVREDTGEEKSIYLYVDKTTGDIQMVDVGVQYRLQGNTQMGGRYPFISPNSMWLGSTKYNYNSQINAHRIINDQLNNDVHDIVVNHIEINDDNGNLRKVQYTYNKPKPTPDNSSTFYGEVITENKGVGTGNIGKVVKVFNTGEEDLSMGGLPLEVLTIDTNDDLVKKTSTTWQKYTKSFSNGSTISGYGYYIRPTNEKETLFFNGAEEVVSQTTNSYNSYGLKTTSISTDSKGKSLIQNINYAYQQYTFVNDKNMLSFPYQTTTKINNVIVNVSQSKWVMDNGKVYINETWSGPSTSNLRLNSQISKVEATTGNVLENNNGKGLYNAVLFGYDNLYEVATVSNIEYQDLVDELDVTYAQLQDLTTENLKTELLKLYDRLPNTAINLSFYDDNGRVVSTINERKEEAFVYYDTLGRQDYITDANGNILEKKNYYIGNQ